MPVSQRNGKRLLALPFGQFDRIGRGSAYNQPSIKLEAIVVPEQKAASAKASVRATGTPRHLAAELAGNHEVPKKQAEAMLGDLVAIAARYLNKGDKVGLNGIGVLQVRKRPARMGRNPATGEAIKIKASKKVAFRAAKELKGAVQPGLGPW